MAKKTQVRRSRPLKFKITKKGATTVAGRVRYHVGLAAGRAGRAAVRAAGREASRAAVRAAGRALFHLINNR